MNISYLDRCAGALVGLACGDAVGTTVEFKPRGSFEPVTDMVGGGPFKLQAGKWTDDTSMALCLAESLLAKKGFDAFDQMERYVRWARHGYLSSTGACFDIGGTVSAALRRFVVTNNPFAGSTDPNAAGNGALMRLAPVVIYYFANKADLYKYAMESTLTTHAAPEAVECSTLLACMIDNALSSTPRECWFANKMPELRQAKVINLAAGCFFDKKENDIAGTGYSVASLEAALWCFYHSNSFEEAVLKAVNLGDDADTTAAIVGQIAGAYYGVNGIPLAWRERLFMAKNIESIAYRLAQCEAV